jgi:hypothetical protein
LLFGHRLDDGIQHRIQCTASGRFAQLGLVREGFNQFRLIQKFSPAFYNSKPTRPDAIDC